LCVRSNERWRYCAVWECTKVEVGYVTV
jgi:hypothetical protein